MNMAAAEQVLTLPVQRETWLHERYQKADLRAVLKMIAAAKKTGALTLHFSNGAVGDIEWKVRGENCRTPRDRKNILT